MAFVKDDDEEKLGQPGQAQGSETVLSSGNTAQGPGGAPQAAGSGPAEKPKGTGWTNLVSYVDANKPQAQGMAQKVVGNVGTKANEVKTNAGIFATGANEAIANQTPKRDDSIIADIGTNAASVANDATRRQQYEDMRTASYQGPKSANEIEGYQENAQGYQNVAKSADALEDFEQRRGTIAQAYEPRSDYTAGESRLDSFLVGQGPARETILEGKGTYGTGSEYGKGWDDLLTGIGSNIDAADATANKIKTDTNDAMTGAVEKIGTTFSGYSDVAGASNKANQATFDRLGKELVDANPNVRNKAFAEIGLDSGTGEWLLKNGADLKGLIAAGKERTAGDYAKDDELAQFNALSSLSPSTGLDQNLATRTGNDANAFKSNQQKIEDGRQAKALQDSLENRLKTEQGKRDSELKVYTDAITSYNAGPSNYSADPTAHLAPLSRLTGISTKALAEAQAKGLNIDQYLTTGKNLNVGDVATDDERSGWASLLGKIGINPTYDVRDTQDEGKSGFDSEGLRLAIDQLLKPKPIATAAASNQQQDPKKAVEAEAMKQKAIAGAGVGSGVIGAKAPSKKLKLRT
jgi:hypothetical protein